MASQGTSIFAVHDSSFTDSMGVFHAGLHTDQYAYTGVDTVMEAGTSFPAISFLFNQYSNGQPSPYPETDWWAPSIGFLVKTLEVDSEPQADGAIRLTTDLISYTLK